MHYSLVEIATLALSLAGVIWKVSQIQNEIYSHVIREIGRIERTLDLHIASQQEKEEMNEYLINDCKASIEHKAKRLDENIKEIKLALQTKGIF